MGKSIDGSSYIRERLSPPPIQDLGIRKEGCRLEFRVKGDAVDSKVGFLNFEGLGTEYDRKS